MIIEFVFSDGHINIDGDVGEVLSFINNSPVLTEFLKCSEPNSSLIDGKKIERELQDIKNNG